MTINRTLPIVAAAMFGITVMLTLGTANAQDKAQTCDATAAAYKALAATSTDPDVADENKNVEAAISDCKKNHLDDGIAKINKAMARIHDGVKSQN
ncbi:MAG TPA: hypothetical protein VHA10_16570 [Hypericibacter adhaerens]|jgi:hypothetical protein|uniref:Uncharacterized protein n=1 Tax=Hypericibacter adhaerens TaxID=2602016 RepID=A0A5J6MTI3_9PROT|nr:hypothetical protein [Hypericibacter adhaerens]QEX20962.1 hypothetical protein FRZ61_08820 [Hypericibacter adhaerens]HWA44834.1 hypothetical protein [Hypericibacter adhaerens]